jgi:hypothetical protein
MRFPHETRDYAVLVGEFVAIKSGDLSGELADDGQTKKKPASTSAPTLQAPPRSRTRLWSLLALIKTYAHQLADVASQLGAHPMPLMILSEQGKKELPDFYRDEIQRLLGIMQPLCTELGMAASLRLVNRILDDLQNQHHDTHSLCIAVKEVHGRIIDELVGVHFFHVPLNKLEFYDQPWFGESVEARFDNARDDMREAANCFALARNGGVVLHCMGIVQTGLEALAKHLRIKIDIQVDDWNQIITKIEGGISKKRAGILKGNPATRQQKSRWAKLEPFYSDIVGEVRAIKNAWRNPGFHFRRRDFEEAKAKEILDRVKDFMRNLAANLPKP